MYDEAVRARAAGLLAEGLSLNAVSKQLGVSRAALRDWRDHPQRRQRSSECPRCCSTTLDDHAYAHLLGLYLGDGCVSLLRKEVYSLRITCDQRYPNLIAEARESLAEVRPGAKTYVVPTAGCVNVQGFWKHWVCLFPQHGPGRKHDRPIVLADWQREIVEPSRPLPARAVPLRRLSHHELDRPPRGGNAEALRVPAVLLQ